MTMTKSRLWLGGLATTVVVIATLIASNLVEKMNINMPLGDHKDVAEATRDSFEIMEEYDGGSQELPKSTFSNNNKETQEVQILYIPCGMGKDLTPCPNEVEVEEVGKPTSASSDYCNPPGECPPNIITIDDGDNDKGEVVNLEKDSTTCNAFSNYIAEGKTLISDLGDTYVFPKFFETWKVRTHGASQDEPQVFDFYFSLEDRNNKKLKGLNRHHSGRGWFLLKEYARVITGGEFKKNNRVSMCPEVHVSEQEVKHSITLRSLMFTMAYANGLLSDEWFRKVSKSRLSITEINDSDTPEIIRAIYVHTGSIRNLDDLGLDMKHDEIRAEASELIAKLINVEALEGYLFGLDSKIENPNMIKLMDVHRAILSAISPVELPGRNAWYKSSMCAFSNLYSKMYSAGYRNLGAGDYCKTPPLKGQEVIFQYLYNLAAAIEAAEEIYFKSGRYKRSEMRSWMKPANSNKARKRAREFLGAIKKQKGIQPSKATPAIGDISMFTDYLLALRAVASHALVKNGEDFEGGRVIYISSPLSVAYAANEYRLNYAKMEEYRKNLFK